MKKPIPLPFTVTDKTYFSITFGKVRFSIDRIQQSGKTVDDFAKLLKTLSTPGEGTPREVGESDRGEVNI